MIGARRAAPGEPTVSELVRRLRELNSPESPFVALFDARSVAGERHLLSAWAHLGRARSRGEARLRDRGAEFALFVAGDDQLPRALAKVGLLPDSEEFVLAVERPRTLAETLATLSLVEAPAVYPRPVGAEMLARLGIGEAERSVVPPAAWEGIVLERVACVDLTASRSTPSAPRKRT